MVVGVGQVAPVVLAVPGVPGEIKPPTAEAAITELLDQKGTTALTDLLGCVAKTDAY